MIVRQRLHCQFAGSDLFGVVFHPLPTVLVQLFSQALWHFSIGVPFGKEELDLSAILLAAIARQPGLSHSLRGAPPIFDMCYDVLLTGARHCARCAALCTRNAALAHNTFRTKY